MKTREWLILVPTDLVNHDDKTDEEIREELGQYAIDEAREEADDYVIPAQWEAKLIAGDIRESFEVQFLVKRHSR
jgi:hypothetical protein